MDSGVLEEWMPSYTLHQSPRLKRLSLKIDPKKGLLLCVPDGVGVDQAERFLMENRSWLWQHRQLLERAQCSLVFPEQLNLLCLEECWSIVFRQTPVCSDHYLRYDRKRLCIYYHCDKPDVAVFARLCQQWLRRRAKQFFPAVLRSLSEEMALPYKDCSIRLQQSRWGSCSSNKNISLNAKLLFYPKQVLRYVMVHELCHTVHMNHSKAFWQLVAKHQSDYKQWVDVLKQRDRLPAIFC